MKHLITLLLGTIGFSMFSQSVPVDVISEKTESGYTLKAINNTEVAREFTLTLTTENLNGYTNPIKVVVPPKSTVTAAELTKVPNEYVNLKFKFSHKAIPAKKTTTAEAKKTKEGVMTSLKVTPEDIVVFTKEDCDICDVVISYLNENKINFKQINVSKNPENHRSMWDLVRIENPNAEKVSIPVFLVKGKLNYNEKDIQGFVQGLKN